MSALFFPTRTAEEAGIPWRQWSALSAVAVLGSLLYGGSLSLVLPGWKAGASALWLALSAGLAWSVFIPVLWKLSRGNWMESTSASLVTMAAGEAVLAAGALMNGVAAWHGPWLNAAFSNALLVAFSNVVMAAVLATRMRRLGVPIWQTLGAWMLFLNGSGALFFAFFLKTLHGL